MQFSEYLKLLETFNELGKLSPEQLRKGQRLDPVDHNDDNFKQVSGRTFAMVATKLSGFDALKDQPRGLSSLSDYGTKDYNQMQCYLGHNNTSGYCLKGGNELVSVFSTAGSSGNAIVADAVKNGATHLDCFAERLEDGRIDGPLFRLYSKHGFRVDTSMNSGTPGEAYAIERGVSSFVSDSGQVEPENPNVVIFMKR